MRSHWICVSLQTNDWCPYKEREVWRQTVLCDSRGRDCARQERSLPWHPLSRACSCLGFRLCTTRSERFCDEPTSKWKCVPTPLECLNKDALTFRGGHGRRPRVPDGSGRAVSMSRLPPASAPPFAHHALRHTTAPTAALGAVGSLWHVSPRNLLCSSFRPRGPGGPGAPTPHGSPLQALPSPL